MIDYMCPCLHAQAKGGQIKKFTVLSQIQWLPLGTNIALKKYIYIYIQYLHYPFFNFISQLWLSCSNQYIYLYFFHKWANVKGVAHLDKSLKTSPQSFLISSTQSWFSSPGSRRGKQQHPGVCIYLPMCMHRAPTVVFYCHRGE